MYFIKIFLIKFVESHIFIEKVITKLLEYINYKNFACHISFILCKELVIKKDM